MNRRDTVSIPPLETVPDAIAWWAVATPDAPALFGVHGDVSSYAQLQTRIEEFARQLIRLGIERGDRVILALPDGVAAAVAALATIRTAVGVPVNPTQSRAEVEPILAAVAPKIVIVGQGAATAWRDAATHTNVQVLALDAAGGLQIDGEPPVIYAISPAPPNPDDLAMILLTSGTTDVPRSAPVTHGNVLAVCSVRAITRRITPRDRGLCTAPAYFVIGLAQIMEALITGGSAIVTSPSEIIQQPEAIGALEPTWTWISPALLASVLEAAQASPAFREWPLRFVRSGGAHLTPDLVARAEALWGVPVLTAYGTTETLGLIASEESPDTIPRKPGSVGVVWPGLDVAIRTADGEPLPLGTVGEITVRGPTVFSGYLGDPEATEAAFFPGRWYRTGDLGYLDDDGYLFVTGRLREMINRGGEKIAPTEIDGVLRAHPAVADAATFGLPDARLGEEIAAAVVLRETGALSERELRRWVARRVSPHKIPRHIWVVEALPRTGSGKVQRGELSRRFSAPVAGR
jgi:acyl-CoA synthetase (AMP-forming)/AMP-acid ligase II